MRLTNLINPKIATLVKKAFENWIVVIDDNL